MDNKCFRVKKNINKNLWYDLATCNNDISERQLVCLKYGCVFSSTKDNAFYVFPVNVYLDDLRRPPRNWFIVDNIIDMKQILLHCSLVELISLDHDIGDESKYGNGYDVLTFIEQRVFEGTMVNPPKILIHTSNEGARPKMEAAVKQIEKLCSQKREP